MPQVTRRAVVWGLVGMVSLAGVTFAQGFDPATLLNPPKDSWPTYHGDYSGRRHSTLGQITPANVRQLTLAWAFQTNQGDQIKASPILHNGVIYISTPDNMWAIDARAGRQIWRYTYPTNQGFHIGHRCVAIYKDLVYLTTPDAHLVALMRQHGVSTIYTRDRGFRRFDGLTVLDPAQRLT